MSAAITAKGQITVSKRVRDLSGIGPGSRVDFVIGEDRSIRLVKAEDDRPRKSAREFLGYAKGEMSTDQIMALLRGDD